MDADLNVSTERLLTMDADLNVSTERLLTMDADLNVSTERLLTMDCRCRFQEYMNNFGAIPGYIKNFSDGRGKNHSTSGAYIKCSK